MTHPFIEHVNLTVSDPDRTAGILSAIFGWHERWRGAARDGGRTILGCSFVPQLHRSPVRSGTSQITQML